MKWQPQSQSGCVVVVDGRPRYLPQVKTDIHTTIFDITSRTHLTQQFVNPSSKDPIDEISYVFPLYDGVSVISFTCTVADRIIKGVVKERQQARRDYTQAKEEGRVAGLVEQSFQAVDVFTTTVGNVPAGGKVVVEIVYIGELKHDAQADRVRLTIPTRVAPRYGSSGLETNGIHPKEEGISMTVDVEMPEGSFIESLASPSHPVVVSIGALSTAEASSERSFNKASAVLHQTNSTLDHDFVIEVSAKGLMEPTAVLELHPTIPNQRALMATLVPKFNMPVSELPEIVFLCDRSGSMETNIINLVVALTTFLKSLPIGVKFNIFSFGSSYTSLWPRSRKYDQETLDQAVAHINTFRADYGGTEIYPAMDGAFRNAYKDLNLEVFLLTDGQIWNQEALFKLINDQAASTQGRVRVFSLGIGHGASSALVEGVARAGNGFAQMVSDNERIDDKVVRMLRGALLPHINEYTLEIKYGPSADSLEEEDDFEFIERVVDSLHLDTNSEKETVPRYTNQQQIISLYDPTVDTGITESTRHAKRAKHDHLLTVEAPRYLQTPTQIPQLYPSIRTTVYVLLSDATPEKTPKSVLLKGAFQDTILELEIPVKQLPEKSTTIHQLAARNETKHLEQGSGWLSRAVDSDGRYLRDKFESRFSEIVECEAVRLGVQFQVAGKHCSFVAVEELTSTVLGTSDNQLDSTQTGLRRTVYPSQSANHSLSDYQMQIMLLEQQNKKRLMMARQEHDHVAGNMASQSFSLAVPSSNNPGGAVPATVSFPTDFGTPLGTSGALHSGDVLNDFDFDSFLHDGSGNGESFDFNTAFTTTEEIVDQPLQSLAPAPAFVNPGSVQASPDIQSLDTGALVRLHNLISLQTFAGSWILDHNLETVLGISSDHLLRLHLPDSVVNHTQWGEIIATACVISFLSRNFSAERGSWEMLVEKADRWLQERVGDDVAALKAAIESSPVVNMFA
ncbi:unnamed protein product [Clonostachys rosea f. rosea IK726]|uniref:VIT domain-containing protein n=2 Tax=Bionectria ochroleuca TaxID=29856 RepID=A0A0B7JTX2_BIOOC|nr:unnamed protein product [Clonostachys rosea f. rosea IK726]